MLTVKPSGVWKFYSCMVYIYLVSHMQSLLHCAESIGGIERSSCFSESFTKSVSLAIWLRFLWLLMVLLFAIVVIDDGALGLLVNLFVIYCETYDVLWYICDVYDIYVVLVIYMCCWWYICDIGDVCYIYLLFVWMGCKKQIKRLFSVILPSAMAMTLDKVTTWEHALPSAKAIALDKNHIFA